MPSGQKSQTRLSRSKFRRDPACMPKHPKSFKYLRKLSLDLQKERISLHNLLIKTSKIKHSSTSKDKLFPFILQNPTCNFPIQQKHFKQKFGHRKRRNGRVKSPITIRCNPLHIFSFANVPTRQPLPEKRVQSKYGIRDLIFDPI